MWFSKFNSDTWGVTQGVPDQEGMSGIREIVISSQGPCVDISNLPGGTYLIKLPGADGNYVSNKLIVVRS